MSGLSERGTYSTTTIAIAGYFCGVVRALHHAKTCLALCAALAATLTQGADPGGKLPRTVEATVDSVGDPLPECAALRFGTLRFRHPSIVYELELSPDGQSIATAGERLIVWDANTGRKRWDVPSSSIETNIGAGYGLRRIAFAPEGDKLYLVWHSRTVDVLDSRTGEKTSIRLQGPEDARGDRPDMYTVADPKTGRLRMGRSGFHSIDVSSDGRLLAVGSFRSLAVCNPDGRLLYEVANTIGEWPSIDELNKDRLSFNGPYAYGRFSPDGSMLAVATSGEPNVLRVLRAESGEEVKKIDLSARPVHFAFSLDSIHVATSERDHVVRLYETETGRKDWEHAVSLKNPFENYTSAVAYSLDGSLIAVAATDNKIHLIDAATGAGKGELVGHHWYPMALRFSSDSRTLYSSGWDGRVRRWDVRTLKQLPIPAGVPGSEVISASPAGDEIAYADDVGGLHFVDAKNGKERLLVSADGADYSQLAFSHDGRQLAAGGNKADQVIVHIWDVGSGVLKQSINWPKGRDPHSAVEDLCWAPDDSRLVAAVHRQSRFKILNPETGEIRLDLKHVEVEGLSISPDGQTLATAGWDSRIRFWNLKTGEAAGEISMKELHPKDGGDMRIRAIRFDPSGKQFATTDLDGRVRIWDFTERKVLRTFSITGRPSYVALAYSPDGRRLATGNSAGQLEIWDPNTGRLIWNTGRHQDHVYTVSFGANANQLITGGDDGVGYLWNLPTEP